MITKRTIQSYCESVSSEANDQLLGLIQHQKTCFERSAYISSPYQGRVLAMISSMIQPKKILEVGSYIGYSALCLCEGLMENGKLITIEKTPRFAVGARNYFADAQKNIELIVGDAIEVIPKLTYEFDLVFIDGDKPEYIQYYDLAMDKLRPGGFIVADNTLWIGKVADDKYGDKETMSLRQFNSYVECDERVENLLVPFLDGLTIIRKVK